MLILILFWLIPFVLSMFLGYLHFKIVIIANSPEWDSVKITLNCMGILVSRQEGHSKFEPVNTIPLEVLRMFQ